MVWGCRRLGCSNQQDTIVFSEVLVYAIYYGLGHYGFVHDPFLVKGIDQYNRKIDQINYHTMSQILERYFHYISVTISFMNFT